MLVLSSLLGLKSKQVDYAQAFRQATLSKDEQVFMCILPGYKTEHENTVLNLKKTLCGLRQAAYNWQNHLKTGFEQLGRKPSEQEPCLQHEERHYLPRLCRQHSLLR